MGKAAARNPGAGRQIAAASSRSHLAHSQGPPLRVQLIAQTAEAKARIAAARSAAELRGALRFLAEVARDGASLCVRLRDELEPLGRPPPLASQIDRADATVSLLMGGLSALARDALEQAQDATTAAELRVGARNLSWFADRVAPPEPPFPLRSAGVRASGGGSGPELRPRAAAAGRPARSLRSGPQPPAREGPDVSVDGRPGRRRAPPRIALVGEVVR